MVQKIKKNISLPYLMYAFVDTFKEDVLYDSTLLDKDGNCTVCPVDEFSGKEFMLNENGFIMNDIMAFEESASDSVARAVLERCRPLHSQNFDQSMSSQQMLDAMIPANFSTPAEYMKLQQAFAIRWYENVTKQQQAKEQKIEFEKNDVPPTNE